MYCVGFRRICILRELRRKIIIFVRNFLQDERLCKRLFSLLTLYDAVIARKVQDRKSFQIRMAFEMICKLLLNYMDESVDL